MNTNQVLSLTSSEYEWSAPDFSINTAVDNYVYVGKEVIKLLATKKEIFKRKDFTQDYFYFCHTIARLHRDKRFKDREYVNINHEKMISFISEYHYPDLVKNLTSWKVIECDNSYQVGSKSKGYKLLAPYNRKFTKVMITDKLLNEKLNKFKKEQLAKQLMRPYQYRYIEMWNQSISMDVDAARRYNRRFYLNPIDIDTYEHNNYSIENYENKHYWFNVDDYFGNRAHTNLTNLSRELRRFLRVQGERLGQVDIKNSQPLFFYTLIKDEPKIPLDEKLGYKELVESGLFYEFFMDHFGISSTERDQYKQFILTGLFSDKNRPVDSRYFSYFENTYPQIAGFIKETKRIDLNIEKIGNDYYKNLICLMQREESRFVIEGVVGEFIRRYEGEFIGTIHDSIVAKKSMLEAVKDLMMECFEMIGIEPQLKVSEYI